MTVDDLPAAFDTVPAAWRAVLPGWTLERQTNVVDGIRQVSGPRPIGPPDPFRALRLVAPADVKVLIVGQDPYPTPGQADGMAFSAARVSARPSLRRIFEILEADRPGWRRPASGRLDGWACQGVLLLNTALTVELDRAGSHLNIGWEVLTFGIVEALQQIGSEPVAMVWGNHAQAFLTSGASTDIDEGQVARGRLLPASARPRPLRILATRHPSNDFQRGFMKDGSHFAATADRVDWWAIGNGNHA